MRLLQGLGLVAVVAMTLPAEGKTVKYYHVDAVGSVRVVTNGDGAVVERHDYLPFGEECTTGGCASNPALSGGEPRKYTGKERDKETGLDYFGARYYGAKTGRFTAVDPVYSWNENLLDPQRWNRYSYGRNNPLRYVDPDGRDAIEVQLGLVNAFGSNASFGIGRQPATSPDFARGQAIGDALSIPFGAAEASVGRGLVGVGLAAELPSAGASTVAVAGGGVMVVHGGTMSVAGSANLGIFLAKSVAEMAQDLADRLGKNTVPYRTPGKVGHIDLAGKGHYDKKTGQTIPTPHVQEMPYGPNGPDKKGKTTRPATKQDVRIAEKLAERK